MNTEAAYAFVHIVGVPFIVLPLLVSSYVLNRQLRDFSESLTIVTVLLFVGVGVSTVFLNFNVLVPLLSVLYVVVPLFMATVFLLLQEYVWDDALWYGVIAWAVGSNVYLLTPFFPVPRPLDLIEALPGLFGVPHLLGYLVYLVFIGSISVGMAALLVRYSHEGYVEAGVERLGG